MKKIFIYLPILLILSSCGGNPKQSKKTFWDDCDVIATRELINGDTVIVCNPDLIKQKKNIPIDLLVEDFKIIKLDNSKEEAFISTRFPKLHLSTNYIGVTSYGSFPMKLFRRDGTFVRQIGSKGQGPGEYAVIDDINIDEKNDRIYILPFSADNILVYDLNGRIYPSIPLVERIFYGSTIKVFGDKREVLITKPISPNTNYFAWIQNFEGDLIQGIKVTDYFKNVTSFSESTITRLRTNAVELFRFGFFNQNEFLYHYDIDQNKLVPKFKIDGDEPYIFIYELPRHFVVEKAQSTRVNDKDIYTPKIIVDKETLRGCYFEGFVTSSGLNLGHYCVLNQMYGPNFAVIDFSSEVNESIKEIKEESLSSLQKEELQKLKSLLPDNEDDDEFSLLFVGKFKQ